MVVPYVDIDDGLVGKVVVQLSHAGENWYDRDPADQTPDRLPIAAVMTEGDVRRLLFGQLRCVGADGRVVAGNAEIDGKTIAGADLEQGIAPGGWVEVIG